MADDIRNEIRVTFGAESQHEAVFDALLRMLKPADVQFSSSVVRKIVPPNLLEGLDEVLLWFSFGPLHILEMRFVFHTPHAEEHDLDGYDGLEAFLRSSYADPVTGDLYEGPGVAQRLFPYYVLTDSFKIALREREA